jgi:ElaB/YqjD/DUF883 family membrane-anchored ribosome-binding protein
MNSEQRQQQQRQQQRHLEVLKEAREAIAQADQVLAKANSFFNGEGQALKKKLESLPADVRERIEAEAQQAVLQLEREAAQAVQRGMFEQNRYGYKPRSGRKLV